LQKERSRKAGNIQSDDWIILKEMSSEGQEDFLGYDHLNIKTYISRYRRVQTPKGAYYHIVLTSTPFYAEGGGQLGDSGYIENENERISIVDTRKENGLFIHIAEKLPENPALIFKAVVDENRRKNIEKNHSATHLLHYALRNVLGVHIAQKGSYVGPDRLRFDFSHAQKLSYEQLRAIETLVQEMIDKDLPLQESRELPLEKTITQGAIALFGEKYGNKVRSVGFGPSLELCGGTHVRRSGEIGLFKIIAESSVGSGIRRIEALSSKAVLIYLKKANKSYQGMLAEMHHPADPLKFLRKLQEENKSLRAQIDLFTAKEIRNLKKEWLTKAQKHTAFTLICEKTHLSPSSIKTISLELRREYKRLILLIAHAEKNEATLHVAVSDDLVDEGVDASYIIQKLVPYIKGKGGGQKFFATGKGSDPEGLAEAFKRPNDFIPL
ncbi:alanine--tRNA ligase-related protein, partial [Bacteroidetes bacterium endosymbiont of Geopemphigus sp.]